MITAGPGVESSAIDSSTDSVKRNNGNVKSPDGSSRCDWTNGSASSKIAVFFANTPVAFVANGLSITMGTRGIFP